MRFETPFDASLARSQSTLYWKTINRKKIAYALYYAIVSLPGILVGQAWIKEGQYPGGFFFFTFGVYILSIAVRYFPYYFKIKRNYFAQVESLIKKREINAVQVWTLEADRFSYADGRMDISLKWEMFNGYRLIGQNLCLEMTESAIVSFILGEEEIGQEAFKDVVAFVKERVPIKPA